MINRIKLNFFFRPVNTTLQCMLCGVFTVTYNTDHLQGVFERTILNRLYINIWKILLNAESNDTEW